jgi:glycosyltransferase involved in cell wall biosynthesis
MQPLTRQLNSIHEKPLVGVEKLTANQQPKNTHRPRLNIHPVFNDLPEVSCIIPAYNEEANIIHTIRAISEEMQRLNRDYEIIVVDDGSQDETIEQARSLISFCPLRIISLSRNFGKENAITAGLSASIGDACIIIDADLQEPVSYIEVFLENWDAGYEMVYGVRSHRKDESLIKRKLSNCFYWILDRSTSVSIPAHARDFRLMDRKVVDALLSLPERNRFMKGLYSWIGFKSMPVPIEIDKRNGGDSKFNFGRLFDLALTGLTSFSDMPLRVWTGVGAVISMLSIFYALLIAGRTLFFGVDVPGWSTLTVAVCFLGGVQILSIGILGEYVGRIFSEVKARPGHIVSKEYSYRDHQPE